jgi:hypothetical protein
MTVQLGLRRASLLGLTLLSVGGVLCGAGFILQFAAESLIVLSVFLVIMAAAYSHVLSKFLNLYRLSGKLVQQEIRGSTEQDIVELAAKNPKWITLITQSIVVMCLVLLVSKFI